MKPARKLKRRSSAYCLRPGEQLEFIRDDNAKARIRVIYPPHVRIRKVKRD